MKNDYAAIYQRMHEDSESRFAGFSALPHVDQIARLVRRTEAKTLLDYGSGKGRQYTDAAIHNEWGGILPRCYDVGVPDLAKKPVGEFDGVICTDVLEHIAEEDLDEVLADLFGYARLFLFLSIATREAQKNLPDGRNAHLTVQPSAWWKGRIQAHPRPRSGLILEWRFIK